MPKIGNQKCFKSLYLGRQFENNVRTIRFDISEWVQEFGEGTVELLHMRHEDVLPYSVPFSRVNSDGNEDDSLGIYVVWKVSSIDTAQAFIDGHAELRYIAKDNDGYLLKSETYRTVVSEALGTPLPEEDWYKSLISKLDSIDDVVSEVTAIRDEILSGETGGASTENNYTTAEKNKLAGIEEGAEANIIISVSVNDVPVDIVDKNVSLRIPTKVSELTNDSGYLSEHQDISGKLDVNKVGVSGGVAELDANGIIVTTQLPSFVDDVLEYSSVSNFPDNGESSKIYVANDTNKIYRWSGSTYIEISSSLALGETFATAYRGDRGKIAYEHSQTRSGNPHNVSKTDVGLGNVDNTSDADKPVSTAQQAAIDLKVDKVTGKGLSTEDYTTAEKTKLSGIDTGATATAIDDTLSNAGEAADAEATGDAISDLKSEISRLKELINGVDAPVYRKTSGNFVTFADGYDNVTLKSLVVMILPTQDGTPSVETPIPISGYSSVTVQRTGKNMARIVKFTKTAKFTDSGMSATLNADGSVSVSGTVSDASGDAVLTVGNLSTLNNGVLYQKGNYILSANIPEYSVSAGRNRVRAMLPSNRWFAAYRPDEEARITVDVPQTGIYLDVIFEDGYAADNLNLQVMIRPEGLGDASWVPYDGQSVNIPFVDADNGGASLTVYGGILDVISGKLTVTHGNIASYDGETVPDGWISSTGELSTGAQVVYPLVTPVTYELTPVSITSLHGYNCISVDVGTLLVIYRSDTSLA